jgi:hypothetical protein
VTGIPASVQFKQRHELEKRAATAAHTLHQIYVLTPNQTLGIVYANAWSGIVCVAYVIDDARQQRFIRYAVFEKNSKFVNYDLNGGRHREQVRPGRNDGSDECRGEGAQGRI